MQFIFSSLIQQVNPNISFEVFIHKADGLSDEHKIGKLFDWYIQLPHQDQEIQRDIQQQAMDLLEAEGGDEIHMSFYLTSIYDHSIFEAFSKVIQKLIPQLPTLENLLDILISVIHMVLCYDLFLTRKQNCRMEKAFLIDVVSKIYVATDSSPVDMQTYELCSDMIDVVVDVSCIYGYFFSSCYFYCFCFRLCPSNRLPITCRVKEDGEAAYDEGSQSIIKLSNGMVLYMREVNRYLALVCFMRQDNFDKQGNQVKHAAIQPSSLWKVAWIQH
jgi:Ras-related GTP-binding protein C/D